MDTDLKRVSFNSAEKAEKFRCSHFSPPAPNYSILLRSGATESYSNAESVDSAIKGRDFVEIIFAILQPPEGIKHDSGKLRWSLMPWGALTVVLQVLEYGAAKYAPDNWKLVESWRYKDALLRHCLAYAKGEELDEESGLPHLAHAACCILFILSLPKEPK